MFNFSVLHAKLLTDPVLAVTFTPSKMCIVLLPTTTSTGGIFGQVAGHFFHFFVAYH